MRKVSVVDAEAHSSELVECTAMGEPVCITRRGNPIANPRKRIDLAPVRSLTDGMPKQQVSAGEFVRRMRDEDRY